MSPYAITVLIPVRNGENFLAEALKSVFAQTHPAAAVLVIDDGSTDGTVALARSFGDRIRVLHQDHQGIAAARNAGLTHATTPWVALLDHDDIWKPFHLEATVAAMKRRPDADVIYGTARRIITDAHTGSFASADLLPFPAEEDVPRLLLERCAFLTTTATIRGAAARAVNGFDHLYINLQDWDLWVRMLRNGSTFASIGKPTALYRIHQTSQTHAPLRALRFSRDVVERNVLPTLPVWRRIPHGLRVISRLEGEAAIVMREVGAPGAMAMMARSILRWPYNDLKRYRVLLHLLLHGYRKREMSRSISRPHTT